MFAHQVIDDFKKQMKSQYGSNMDLYVHQMRTFTSILQKKAQCFHVGEIQQVSSYTQSLYNSNNSNLFMENCKYIKLPYSAMWVDATATMCPKNPVADIFPTKEGILGVKIYENGTDLFILCYVASYYPSGAWGMPPCAFLVSVGRDFNDEDLKKINLTLLDKKNMQGNIIYLMSLDAPSSEVSKLVDCCAINLRMLNDLLLLLNCKNIIEKNNVPSASLNAARRVRGRQELFTYKTLQVDIGRNGGGTNGINLYHNRLHLCRGHFKRYTDDNPLFGKYTGLYWWQPQLRGKNKDGMVVKDYDIRT
jgi:hypothetical protein